MQREHVAAAEAAGGEPGGHALDAGGELAVGQRRARSRRRSARARRRAGRRGAGRTRRSTSGTSGELTAARPTGCSERRHRDLLRRTIRFERFRPYATLRTDVNRSCALGPVSYLVLGIVALRGPSTLVRPQALRAAQHRPLLALPAHAALRRARAARRGRPARGDARGERPAAALLRDHRRRARSGSASGSPSRSRARWSTATSGCSSCSSPSSPARARCIALALEQAAAQRAKLAEYEAIQRALRATARSSPPAALARARHPPGPRRRRVLGGRG